MYVCGWAMTHTQQGKKNLVGAGGGGAGAWAACASPGKAGAAGGDGGRVPFHEEGADPVVMASQTDTIYKNGSHAIAPLANFRALIPLNKSRASAAILPATDFAPVTTQTGAGK